MQQKKITFIVFILILLMTSCIQKKQTVTDTKEDIAKKQQIENAKPSDSEEKTDSGQKDLDNWLGYYHASHEFPDDLDQIDFIIHKEETGYFGYLYLEGSKYIEGEAEENKWKERGITSLKTDGHKLFVYYLQAVPVDGEPVHVLETYDPGELMFSIEPTEEQDLMFVNWENPAFTKDNPLQYEFYRRDSLLWLEIENEQERKFFLRSQGVKENQEPFYSYYDEGGELQVEVYYNTYERCGTGISYGANGFGEPVISGFGIGEWTEGQWQDNKFTVNDEEHQTDLEGYEETWNYNEAGQPVYFRSDGIITGWGEPYKDFIMKIEFAYREDGTLRKKSCQYNHRLFGTTRQSEYFYFDQEERLTYVSSYITYGFLEDFYIYEGNQKKPSWKLTLDHMGIAAAEYEFIKYSNELNQMAD